MARKTQKEIVLNALQNNKRVDRNFAARNGISNIRQVVKNLREEGNPIYTNENSYGERSYRLGTPSARMVAVAYRVLGAEAFGA